METSKPNRRRMIERLLQAGRVTSQHSLLKQLRGEGVDVTQATLSRDLADLGVVKGPTGWQLPGSAATNNSDIRSAVQTYLLDVEAGGQMVVLRTRTGHATPLAVELDRIRLEGSLGTLAGDDTILLVAKSAALARSLAARFKNILQGTSDRPRRPARK
ncbi:MAG: arginine repressor [Planctomycetes bacterium]|nr:arginine repressor [Planctomycetota bacterium]